MGFPTKNDHFGVFWGYHHFRKPTYINKLSGNSPQDIAWDTLDVNRWSQSKLRESCRKTRDTPVKTNMSPENQWLEDVFPTEIVPF